MKNRTDFWTGIALAGFAVAYWVEAGNIKFFKGFGALGKGTGITSRTMPEIWAACLMLLALILVSRAFRGRGKESGGGSPAFSLRAAIKEHREVIATFIALFCYAALMQLAGFIISSAAYIFAQTLILQPKGGRKPALALGLGVVVSIATYFAFVHWLGVLLPVGMLFE
jgi:putative tricarboxylic transport membrane protein